MTLPKSIAGAKIHIAEMKKEKIEVHVRSVFLQGLFFKKPDELKPFFYSIKDKIIYLNRLSMENGFSISDIALNFACGGKGIDRVVIGVESLENLRENVQDLDDSGKVAEIRSKLDILKEENDNIILPFKWPKE